MRFILHKIFLCLFVVSIGNVNAQRIVGYFANYNNPSTAYNNIQYTKLTHLNYFTLNPTRTAANQSDGNLWFNDTYSWFTTTYFNSVKAKAKSVNPNIKIFIVTGGSPGSDTDLNGRLAYIANNAGILDKFCNNIIGFIKANGLDGWDLDWEFPTTAAAKTSHQTLLAKMRQKIDSTNLADCKKYEISIAVGGGYTDPTHACWNPAHTDYLNCATVASVDFVNIMAYDGDTGNDGVCAGASHQDYVWVYQKSYNDWVTKCAIPASKIVMGLGFYNNAGTDFNSNGNNSTWYNMTYYPTGGSGCPNMQSKIGWIKSKGGAGVMIWELTQDNLCAGTVPTCYSLLDCIYQYTTANWGTWTAPSCSPAPVLFESFNLSDNNTSVKLDWVTAWERNNIYFLVDRSSDGIVFDSIAIIPGAGNSNTKTNYEYLDEYPLQGKSYYRITQVDLNGTHTYTDTKVLNRNKETEFYIAPNPFENSTIIKIKSSNGDCSFKVFNTEGKLMSTNEVNGSEIEIEVGSDLSVGVYYVQIISGDEIITKRIIKIK